MKSMLLLALLGLASASPAFRNIDLHHHRHIVGGVEAGRGEFSFIVQIQLFGSHFCGGSIVNENWVISAAHCFPNFPISLFGVVAGEHDLSRNDGIEQQRSIEQIIRHPQYDGDVLNDVALIKVSQPFVFNSSFVQPVQLAWNGAVPSGNLTVAGWGYLVYNGPSPSVLMRVDVPYVEYEVCARSYRLSPGMLCAGVGGRDSCQGDSGGPLVSRNNILVGIVSWGTGCGWEGYPGVYADVGYYYDFIQQNID